MNFPDWVPSDLIKKIQHTERDIEMYSTPLTLPSFFDKIPADENVQLLNWFKKYRENEKNRYPEEDLIGPLQEKLEAYKRLATYEYMREAWSTLERQSINVKDENRKHIVYGLLLNIEGLLTKFPKELAITEPYSKKRKNLARLADQLNKIADEMEDDITASRMIRDFIPAYLGSRVLKHRLDNGEEVRDFDKEYPHHLFDSDSRGFREFVTDMPNTSEWEKRPILERMILWAEMAQRLSINELMRTFADMLEYEAEEKPAILQPWRGDSEKRPYLIRGISAFFQFHFGKPLDDTVALIVSAVLDLDPVLTRDDVRPYLT